MSQTTKIIGLILFIVVLVGGLALYLVNSNKPSGTVSQTVQQMQPSARGRKH